MHLTESGRVGLGIKKRVGGGSSSSMHGSEGGTLVGLGGRRMEEVGGCQVGVGVVCTRAHDLSNRG